MRKKNYWLSSIKDFYFPIVVVFFMLIFSPLFLVPKIRQIFEVKTTIANQQKEITLLSQKLADLQTLSEAELFTTEGLLLEALPANKDFYKVLSLTKKIFDENGALLKSFAFSPGKISTESGKAKEDTPDLTQMLMKVTFSASYSNFSSLLENFSQSLPLMEVGVIKFEAISSTSSASLPELQGTMDIKTFHSPLPKTIGEIEAPLPKISNQGMDLIKEVTLYRRYQPEAIPEEGIVVGKENPFP